MLGYIFYKKFFQVVVLLLVLIFVFVRTERLHDADSQLINKPTTMAVAGFDKTKYSIDKPGSIWVVVNKSRPLPKAYVPGDLVVPDIPLRLGSGTEEMHISKAMKKALEDLILAAKKKGYLLELDSGYRSASFQDQLYSSYVNQSNRAIADQSSARSGYSEHQTGLAADIGLTSGQCGVDQCFGNTPAGKWVAANGYRFGFIVRYPKGKQAVTGYEYEPWHIRYIGQDLAKEMHKNGVLTLEEFFKLPPAPSYR